MATFTVLRRVCILAPPSKTSQARRLTPVSPLIQRALAGVTGDQVQSFNAAMRERTERARRARTVRP